VDTQSFSDTGSYSDLLWCTAHGPAITSEFESSDIPASGSYDSYTISAEMFVEYDEAAGPIGWGLAEAEMDVLFSIDSPADFSLGGSIAVSGTDAGATFVFTGPHGDVCSLADCFPASGVLLAGQYQLHAYLVAGVGVPNSDYDVGSATLILELALTPSLSGVGDDEGMPGGRHLSKNFPNPFNPQTTIAFDLPEEMPVRLCVYAVDGRLVDVLLSDDLARQGRNEVVWRGRDRAGRRIASGTYFYRLQAGDEVETRRMTLLK
jgi:hypothetical protein